MAVPSRFPRRLFLPVMLYLFNQGPLLRVLLTHNFVDLNRQFLSNWGEEAHHSFSNWVIAQRLLDLLLCGVLDPQRVPSAFVLDFKLLVSVVVLDDLELMFPSRIDSHGWVDPLGRGWCRCGKC